MPTNSIKKGLTLTGILAVMSGCSNVVSNTYLHDASLKVKTDQAHSSFGTVDDQSDFFRSATELLEQAGQERMDAQRRRLDALHEFSVASLIADSDGDGSQLVWQRARESFEGELRLVSPVSLSKVSEWPDQHPAIEAARADIIDSSRRVDLFARNYRKSGGTKSITCAQNMARLPASEAGSMLYNRLVRACSIALSAGQELADLLSYSGINSTDYHARRDDLLGQLTAATDARQLIADRIGAARKEFNDESITFEQEAVQELTEKGKKLSAMLASIDDLSFPENNTTLLGVELAQTGDIIEGKTLANSIRAEILTEELEELIRIMSDPDIAIETEVQKEAQRKYLLIVQSDTALRGIRAFREMDFPKPQSALMLLEHYRNVSAAYDRQIRHLTRQYRLSAAAANSAEKKIEHLMNGLQILGELDQSDRCEAPGFASYLKKCKGETTRVARILINLDQAHIQGTLPAELAFETSLNNDMMYGIEASKGHAAHVISILRPAITTLKAYGDGGIKTETIARLMNTLSLISISVGVN